MLCHIYNLQDPEQAVKGWDTDPVKGYGEETRLPDGTIAHDNYECDAGGRGLVRCRTCGALLLVQHSHFEAMDSDYDGSYADWIIDIMDVCEATGNTHLLWFRKLLDDHFSGVIAHATYRISAGKIEGINQKIKTLRRNGYGYPDDEYFFLKLFDMSRQDYVRNTPSHRFND